MSGLAIALVLCSAVFHTLWNGVLKATDDKHAFNAWLLTWCAVWSLPAAAVQLWRGSPLPWEAVGLALVTSLLWLVYYEGLARSYHGGDLSTMYPVGRGSAPLFSALLGLALGQQLKPLGWVGIVAVVLAVWLIGGAPTRLREWAQPAFRAALAVGLCNAAYSQVDQRGTHLCDPLIYLLLENAFSAVWVSLRAVAANGAAEVWQFGRDNVRMMALSALGACAAYLLVLYALALAPAPYVVALRATAVVWSVLYGGLRLREPAMRRRLGFALLLLAGIALLKFGG